MKLSTNETPCGKLRREQQQQCAIDLTMERLRPRMSIIEQFIRFVGVGLVGTCAHYLILISIVGANQDPIFASACGFIGGATVNYTLNRRFTFASSAPHRSAATRFFLVAVFGLAINILLMTFAIHSLRLHYLVAQLFATASVLLWNFTGNRYWTFKEDSDEPC